MSRPRFTVALGTALAVLALAAPAGAAAAGDCPNADMLPTADNAADVNQATLCLLNAERAANGLGALTENASLSRASLAFSQQMVAQSFFAHEAPDGTDLVARLTAVGYLGNTGGDWSVGENIAWAQGSLSTPRSVMQAWMDSPGHRANILNASYAEIGLGTVQGVPQPGQPGTTFTTDFGAREPVIQSSAATTRTAAPAKAAKATKTAQHKTSSARGKTARSRARSASVRHHQRTVWMAKLIG
ncbi:MAG: hypothetical protein JWO74_484 [Solirubrobacterales bacterium]|nr:hypothetical protein [Solirubrobacterales bacterium]